MSGSVNKCIIVGNLARDVEIRSTQDGTKIANMTVVTSERWTDKRTGEKKERAEFNRVVVFNDRLVDVCEKYLSKGSKIYLEGQLQTRKWQDQSGNDKYSTEIVLQRYRGEITMLGDKQEGQQRNQGMGQDHQAPLGDDSEIPF